MDNLADIISSLNFLNLVQARKRCLNDDEFYCELLQTFAEESKLSILQQNYQQQDWYQYRMNVHTIKSSAAYIGADDLSQQAKLLENAARTEDLAYIKAKHDEFVAYYRQIILRIKRALAKLDKVETEI